MSESVPDPDDGMAENVLENMDQIVDEPNADDIEVLDSTNSNQEEFNTIAEMEPAPAIPENLHFSSYNLDFVKENKKTPEKIIVNTEAVDLENICNTFQGAILLERLQFVIDHCPILRRDATIALIRILKENTLNFTRYNLLMSTLKNLDNDSQCTRNLELPQNDTTWVENTQSKSSNLLEIAQSEYKRTKDEGVKESTRRAMEDLFAQYIAVGNYPDALRLYGRGMKEYCTQFKHLMKMWLEWLEITVCAGEWTKVEPLISQTQRSINEAEEAEEVAQNSNRGAEGQGHIDAHSRANRALITASQTKIDALAGVCRMKSGQYSKAVDYFTKTDVDLMGSSWLFSSSDIAVYATLCALVSLDRSQLKVKVLTDSLSRKFLEAEPHLIQLLTSFIRSDFGRCLDILSQRRDSFHLNPFISPHVDEIYQLIRQKAIIQYIRPFVVAKIDMMADVFRVNLEEMEEEVVKLIEDDRIDAKIDAQEGVIRTITKNKRSEAMLKTVQLCDKITETANMVICRAVLTQSRMYTGGEQRNKRKEPVEEGFDPVGRQYSSRMQFRNVLSGRNAAVLNADFL